MGIGRDCHPVLLIEEVRAAALVPVVNLRREWHDRCGTGRASKPDEAEIADRSRFIDAMLGEPDLTVGMRQEELLPAIVVETRCFEPAG